MEVIYVKTRVISAIVALLICIPIIIYGKVPFYVGVSIIGLIGFMELLKLKSSKKDIPYLMKVFGVISFILLMTSNWNILGSLYLFDYEVMSSIIFLMLIPLVFYNKSKKYDINDAFFMIGSILFLGISFNQLVSVRMLDLYYLVFLLLITVFTDTFAYFVGLLIGKNKLCPTVSPKKTWEGFVGGLAFGTFISTVFYITVFNYTGNIIILVLLVALLSVIGQLGDLVFSAIKRNFGIKDFGNIMPGHGGVLDRLDSILFVVLAFSYFIRFL